MMALGILLLLIAVGFPPTAQAASEIMAEVDGVAISSEEVEKGLAAQLSKLEEQIYSLKRQRIEALINEKLLAKEAAQRGISVPALLDAEVTSKVGLVREQEIESFYQANKAQVKGEETQARKWCQACLFDLLGPLPFLRVSPATILKICPRNISKKFRNSYPVESTAGFLVNGRMLVGAQPLENFLRVIDDELARAK